MPFVCPIGDRRTSPIPQAVPFWSVRSPFQVSFVFALLNNGLCDDSRYVYLAPLTLALCISKPIQSGFVRWAPHLWITPNACHHRVGTDKCSRYSIFLSFSILLTASGRTRRFEWVGKPSQGKDLRTSEGTSSAIQAMKTCHG